LWCIMLAAARLFAAAGSTGEQQQGSTLHHALCCKWEVPAGQLP
jgi:hypothetical protein